MILKKNIRWISVMIYVGIIGLLGCQSNVLDEETFEIAKARPSIAVLPFQDMSSDKDQEYFGDGIAEEILNTLANLKELRVAGRTSSFSFKGKEATIEEIGRAMKVDHVLEGSVRKEGDKIRITAQLIKVTDGFHLWSNKYDRNFKDVFEIQDEVAQNIGEVLLKKLAPEQLSKLKTRPAKNSEAYGLFLRAKHVHLNRYYGNYNIKDFNLSEQLFLKAIELDTNYALAYAGLADLYDSHKDALSDPTELRRYDFLKIKHVERAWQLNPNLPYVNIVRGWVMRNKKVEPNDLDAAFDSFLRGYQLNPTSTDGLFGLAFLYEDKSLLADADQLLDKAIELDPFRAANYTVKGDFLMRSGKYKLAVAAHLKALDINPSDLYALSQLAMCYVFLKNEKKAVAIYQQIDAIDASYLGKSVIDSKIYTLLKGNPTKARAIPTSLLDYRGEDVVLNSIIGEVDTLESSFLAWWDWWQNFKGEKVFNQSSAYIELLHHTIYDQIREKAWFQKLLKKEQAKYEQFYATYPRAAELLKQPIKSIASNQPKGSQSNRKKQNYWPYLLLLFLSMGIGFWWMQKRSKTNRETPITQEEEIPKVLQEEITPFVLKLNKVIHENMAKSDFSLPQLCKAMGLSRAQLYRKIKEHTGTSPALYIRSLRLEKAKKLLKTSELNITEIAYEVGFKDLSYFSRSFTEAYGKTPSETRK